MIPRTKVNFTLPDLLRAALIRANGVKHRRRLQVQLGQFPGMERILLTP